MSDETPHKDLPRKNRLEFATRAIHGGQRHDPSTGAVMVPIYATSTYAQASPGVHQGFEYSRSQNPTRFALERALADLESGTKGFAFASGLAAIGTLLETLDAGDHVIASEDLYGGSFRLFDGVRRRSAGLEFSFVDLSDLAAIEAAITPRTRLIWVETPTNPLLRLADLEAIAALARRRGLIAAADNTFASPYIQRPLELGFDIVMHSTTKYIGGHSDMVGGALVVGQNAALRRAADLPAERGRCGRLAIRQLSHPARGEDPGAAHAAALRERTGRRQVAGDAPGRAAGDLSRACPAIRSTSWPGARCTASAAWSPRSSTGTWRGPGRMLERTKLFTLAESLGGVESLIEHPAIMTHASIPAATRERIGIADSLIRLSVGVEAAEDLIADLEQALS